MKTLKIRFDSDYAEEISKLLCSLDITILISWSTEDFGDITIFCILKMDNKGGIPEELRIEKLRENNHIKPFKN